MEKIKKMIKLEKEDTQKNFKQIDFKTQLARRIRLAATVRQKKSFFTIMLRRPAFAAAVAALVLAVVGIIVIWSPFTTEIDRAKIERLLAKFPGLQETIPNDVEKEITLTLTEEESLLMELEWRVQQHFYAISAREYEKEEFIAKVGEMLAINNRYRETPGDEIIFIEPVDPVKLNLEKRIKALMKRKKNQWLF